MCVNISFKILYFLIGLSKASIEGNLPNSLHHLGGQIIVSNPSTTNDQNMNREDVIEENEMFDSSGSQKNSEKQSDQNTDTINEINDAELLTLIDNYSNLLDDTSDASSSKLNPNSLNATTNSSSQNQSMMITSTFEIEENPTADSNTDSSDSKKLSSPNSWKNQDLIDLSNENDLDAIFDSYSKSFDIMPGESSVQSLDRSFFESQNQSLFNFNFNKNLSTLQMEDKSSACSSNEIDCADNSDKTSSAKALSFKR